MTARAERSARVTLKDVASRCGVSEATVTHILGGRGARFREETRRRVRGAAAELGYRPNAAARMVRRGRFDTFILLRPAPPGPLLFPELLTGILGEAEAQGVRVQFAWLPAGRMTTPEDYPQVMREVSADGMLVDVITPIPSATLKALAQLRVPTVWLNNKVEADCVFPDDLRGAYEATRTLLGLGHRRIAFVRTCAGDHYSAADRLAGYERAMEEAGREARVVMPAASAARAAGAAALHALARRVLGGEAPPTACVTPGASDAGPVLGAALARGMRVPEDLSVVTFAPEPYDPFGTPVTTYCIPFEELGRRAVRMLVEKTRKGKDAHPPVAIPYTRVEGDSCRAPADTAPAAARA